MFRLLCGVLSFLKCMCYHSNVVFTTAGGEHRVTVKRHGNARHSKMSKIHTLGLCIHHTQAVMRGKNSFQYKWMTSRECVCLLFFLFFCSPSWKYPAEALGRILLGSQDVNVNFLPVTEETLSHSGPGPLPHGHCAFSQRSLSVSSLLRLAIRH